MSDENTPKDAAGKMPSHLAYTVRESKDGKSYFNRVGSAFEHKDGQGFNVELDATPVNGRLTLRTLKDRLDERRNGNAGRTARTERDNGER